MESPLGSDSSSDTEYSDSDYSDREREDDILIQPYRFEPEIEGDEEVENEHIINIMQEEDAEGRLGNARWCLCSGGCQAMPTVRESLCCKEIDRVVAKMDAYVDANAADVDDASLDCITAHPGFPTVCLDRWVLETAYYQYRQQYGDRGRQDATENQRNRHVAYRQLARWVWGFLGRNVRVPLPSCAVVQIREAFPSNEFRGFHEI